MKTHSRPLNIPAKGDVHTPFFVIEKKIDEITTRDRAEQTEIHALTVELAKANGASRITPQTRRIAAMVGDTIGPDMTPKMARLKELQETRPDNLAALDVLRSKLAIEHVHASRKICEHYADDHKRRVAKICKAIIELRDATASYEELIWAFQEKDIAWSSLRPMQPLFFGSTREKESAPNAYLREAAKYGFINPSEVPQEIR